MSLFNRRILLLSKRPSIQQIQQTRAFQSINNQSHFISKARSAVLTNNTWYNANVKVPNHGNNITTTPTITSATNTNTATTIQKRQMGGFSFAGPRNLSEILKTELIENKTSAEISDIWLTYHEEKDDVHGTIVKGSDGATMLERGAKMPFFIEPIFRDDGFFMLLSQFQTPSHFLLAYLEDYKMDPNNAQPLMTFSIFNDLVESHDISLVRCDIINKGISESEGRRVMDLLLDSYKVDEDFDRWVKMFNEQPASFDIDDYIACMSQKWKSEESSSSGDK